jgi:putative transposase
MVSHRFDQCDLNRLDRSGVCSFSSGLMIHRGEGECESFIRAYPIPSGTASTMWCSCPNDSAKQFSGRAGHLGPIFHGLAKQKECQILEGHLMPDHVHMCIAIPPKHAVASVIGFLKGKSAIGRARLCGQERNFSGEHFWARGYAGSTVGLELEQVRQEREWQPRTILNH